VTGLILYWAVATVLTSAAAMLPNMMKARAWRAAPIGISGLLLAGVIAALVSHDVLATIIWPAVALLITLLVRHYQRSWGWLGAQLMTTLLVVALGYLAYGAFIGYTHGLAAWLLTTAVLALLSLAVVRGLTQTFEMVDALSGGPRPPDPYDTRYLPRIVLQVPICNEPVDVVSATLRSLSKLAYPNYLVQVVENNTTDPRLWQPIEVLCRELGSRFVFIHLGTWPGFKGGALNAAMRRLAPDVEIVGVVDADYIVEPDFLSATVGYFTDPAVGFVQTRDNYRDWERLPYRRGMFFGMRCFYAITMESRARRRAIIFRGTMGLIRRSVLEEVGGWDEVCLIEDAEASLKILGRGYHGVYVNDTYGAGLLPASFEALRKQQYRCAVGGMQIMRKYWRELLPVGNHKLNLKYRRRLYCVLVNATALGELLTLVLTLALLPTAIAIAVRGDAPQRQLTDALVIVPLTLLITQLLRSLWALCQATQCSALDALRALRTGFGLTFGVALGCVHGLLGAKVPFLPTPRVSDPNRSWRRALRSAWVETALAMTAIAAAVITFRGSSWGVRTLGVMLLVQACVFASALWTALSVARGGLPVPYPWRKRQRAAEEFVPSRRVEPRLYVD
jgi:glycosyl transferase family 2